MNVQSPNFRMADTAGLAELADRVRGRLREFAEAAFRLAAEQMQKYQRRSVARGRLHR